MICVILTMLVQVLQRWGSGLASQKEDKSCIMGGGWEGKTPDKTLFEWSG